MPQAQGIKVCRDVDLAQAIAGSFRSAMRVCYNLDTRYKALPPRGGILP